MLSLILSYTITEAASSCGDTGVCTTGACFTIDETGEFIPDESTSGVCLEAVAIGEICQAGGSTQGDITLTTVEFSCPGAANCLADGANGICKADNCNTGACTADTGEVCVIVTDGVFSNPGDDSGLCLIPVAEGEICQTGATSDSQITTATLTAACPDELICKSNATDGVCTTVEEPPVNERACDESGNCTAGVCTSVDANGEFAPMETADGICLEEVDVDAVCQTSANSQDDINNENVEKACKAHANCKFITDKGVCTADDPAAIPCEGDGTCIDSTLICVDIDGNGEFTAAADATGSCLLEVELGEVCVVTAASQLDITKATVTAACKDGANCIYDAATNSGLCTADTVVPPPSGNACGEAGDCSAISATASCYTVNTDGLLTAATDTSGVCLEAVAVDETCQAGAQNQADITTATIEKACPAGFLCLTDGADGVCTDPDADAAVGTFAAASLALVAAFIF